MAPLTRTLHPNDNSDAAREAARQAALRRREIYMQIRGTYINTSRSTPVKAQTTKYPRAQTPIHTCHARVLTFRMQHTSARCTRRTATSSCGRSRRLAQMAASGMLAWCCKSVEFFFLVLFGLSRVSIRTQTLSLVWMPRHPFGPPISEILSL